MHYNENLNFSLNNIRVQYLTGSYTKCMDIWRFNNVTPAYNKFYYIVDGECYIKIDNKEYYATKGQMFLLPFNSTQTYYHFSKHYVSKHWVHCTFSTGDRDLTELLDLPHYIEIDAPKRIKDLFIKINELANDKKVQSKLLQKAYLLELFSYYIEKASTQDYNSYRDNRISIVLEYIEENLSKEITVTELSELLHFHPNYFINYFRTMTNQTPIDYINNARIDKAKRLLLDDNITIKEVADQVGFNNSYYFSRIFKKKTGMSPRDYRVIAYAKPEDF